MSASRQPHITRKLGRQIVMLLVWQQPALAIFCTLLKQKPRPRDKYITKCTVSCIVLPMSSNVEVEMRASCPRIPPLLPFFFIFGGPWFWDCLRGGFCLGPERGGLCVFFFASVFTICTCGCDFSFGDKRLDGWAAC